MDRWIDRVQRTLFACFPISCVFPPQGIISDQERKKMKKKTDKYSKQTSLIVATLKRLLPVGMNTCAPGEQHLVTLAKNRFSEVQDMTFYN